MNILLTLATELNLKEEQVEKTVALIDEGCTIPFIARYRKEVTGSLDDTVLRRRFAAQTHWYVRGLPYEHPSILIDIERFAESPDFAEMLKYINTAPDKQRKGFGGGIK